MENILKDEMDKVLIEIKELYESSGKKVSGQFAEGLELREINPNHYEIHGYGYMAGRPKGKMPPVAEIEKWVISKGIKPLKDEMSINSLAWAIAKKIAREGTDDESHFPIYDKILTPSRIEDIISKVSLFNVNLFVQEITTYMIALTQTYSK